MGEDPDDVEQLAAQGELRSLFTRTDLAVTATPTVLPSVPTPLEARSETASDPQASNELERKLLDHMRRKNAWDSPTFDGGTGMLDLYRRRVAMNESGEQRSAVNLMTVETRTARGHLIDLPVGPDVHNYGCW